MVKFSVLCLMDIVWFWILTLIPLSIIYFIFRRDRILSLTIENRKSILSLRSANSIGIVAATIGLFDYVSTINWFKRVFCEFHRCVQLLNAGIVFIKIPDRLTVLTCVYMNNFSVPPWIDLLWIYWHISSFQWHVTSMNLPIQSHPVLRNLYHL